MPDYLRMIDGQLVTTTDSQALSRRLAARLGCSPYRVLRAGLLALDDAPLERQRAFVERTNTRGYRPGPRAAEYWRRRLLDVLPAAEPGMTKTEIEAALGRRLTNICRASLRQLVDEGLVVRVTLRRTQPRRYYLTAAAEALAA